MMSRRTGEAGFSLIELMVALVITVMVAGSIFGLMTSSQTSFKRDPEITDRQQAIRVAMDLITRDCHNAGMRMGVWIQAFTPGLDNVGPEPSVINPAELTDELQIFGNDGMCPDVGITDVLGVNLVAEHLFPPCYPEPSFLLLHFPDGTTKWGWAHNLHNGDVFFNIPGGQQPDESQITKAPGDFTAPNPDKAIFMQFVRYAIAQDTDGVPCLWRSPQGGIDTAGVYTPAGPGVAQWRMIARGVDDLQVQYMNGNNPGVWSDDPGDVDQALAEPANYGTLIRQVRITLSARTVALDLAGARTGPGGGANAIRGQLTSVVSPRAALQHLSSPLSATLDPQWR